MTDAPRYLDGFLAAVQPERRRITVAPSPEPIREIAGTPTPSLQPAPCEPSSIEEQIKCALHPLDSFARLLDCAETNCPPPAEDQFRFRWFGLFYQAPWQDAFLLRLRLPGGRLAAFQLAGLAKITQEHASGYIVLNSQGGVDVPGVPVRAAAEILHRIEGIGLSAQQTGGDCVQSVRGGEYEGLTADDQHASIYRLVCALEQALAHSRVLSNLPQGCEVAFRGVDEPPDPGRETQNATVVLQTLPTHPSALGADAAPDQAARFLFVVPGDREGGFPLPTMRMIPACLRLLEAWAAGADRTDSQRASLANFCAGLGRERVGDLLGQAEWQPRVARPQTKVIAAGSKPPPGLFIPGARLLSGQIALMARIAEGRGLTGIRLARGCLYVAGSADAGPIIEEMERALNLS